MSGTLQDVMARLYSIDANERVKAANEIGEIGTEIEAPTVLKVAYEDEASTVRQMATQSYFEILGDKGIPEIIKIATEHFDTYTRIYGISCLGKANKGLVIETLNILLDDEDEKIRVSTVRAMIHAQTIKLSDRLFSLLEHEESMIVIRNIFEALALWKYQKEHDSLEKYIEANIEKYDLELKTISYFLLAMLGDTNALKILENDDVDEYIRIKHGGKIYRGRNGLIELISIQT